MNPARSLGPGIVAGDLHAIWIYLLAPITGASLGALAYTFLRAQPPPAAAELEPTGWDEAVSPPPAARPDEPPVGTAVDRIRD